MPYFLSSARERGWGVFGAHAGEGAVSMHDVELPRANLLVLVRRHTARACAKGGLACSRPRRVQGSEGLGIRPGVRRECSKLVHLPGGSAHARACACTVAQLRGGADPRTADGAGGPPPAVAADGGVEVATSEPRAALDSLNVGVAAGAFIQRFTREM